MIATRQAASLPGLATFYVVLDLLYYRDIKMDDEHGSGW